ncbi:MAG: efflux RND transporter periplasmic adaptor subunit [Hyphomonadaceae bacterium]|nr:efflux RND transporter periplasmic adaptor subunit [Hyphomonadaceae bacterium]
MADSATRTVEPDLAAPPLQTPAQQRRNLLLMILAGVVALGIVVYSIYWLTYASHFVSTDNAYVGANSAQITPLVSAPVLAVHVSETQTVHAGDVLVELDPADARLDLAQARAELARAQADYSRARVDLGRRRALAPGGAVSGDELTDAQNAYTASSATVQAARARVEAAQLALTRTTIRAPIDGVVSNKNVDVGQRVAAGAPLMVIAPIDNAYVDANFKEPQLRGIEIGQPVRLTSDVYGGDVVFHGRVAGVSGGTGSAFSVIPAQNASGNWIKVVQRVPVRITLDPAELRDHPLRLGMSMSATVDLRPQTEQAAN